MATVASHEPAALQTEASEGAPDANRNAQSLEPTDGVKEVPLNLEGNRSKMVKVYIWL